MSEEKAQDLLYQMQVLESYLADLMQREATLVNVLRETISAIESLKSLKLKPNSDSLVPIGMGAYVKTKISANDKVVLNIGASVAIEKDADSAINYLESRIKEIEIALQDNASRKQDTSARLEQGKHEMNKLMQAASHKNP